MRFKKAIERTCAYCGNRFLTTAIPPGDYCGETCTKEGRATMHQRCRQAECFVCMHQSGDREDILPACFTTELRERTKLR